MSDIRIVNLKKQKTLKSQKLSRKELQKVVEFNALNLLGLRIIDFDYPLDNKDNEVIETLAIDETYTITIIEYRSGKFGKLINKGLHHVDYIKENISEVKILIKDKLGENLVNQINYNPRLVIIGDDFNKYDEHAIKALPIQVDLIKYQLFDNSYFVLEKNYVSKSIDHSQFTHRFSEKHELELYKSLRDFILSLGDEVIEYGLNQTLCYRKINYFAFITFSDNTIVNLNINNKTKDIIIKTQKDFEKACKYIEQAYDER